MNRITNRAIRELVLMISVLSLVFVFSAQSDLLERFIDFSHNHERLELDELLICSVAALILLLLFAWHRWRESLHLHRQLDAHNRSLRQALEEIRILRGILPICSYCKNIRDDSGYWHEVELYLETHTDARFTHGICPDCLNEHFPQFSDRICAEMQKNSP